MSVPSWLQQLAAALPTATGEHFSRSAAPPDGGRDSAVLALFGDGDQGPDLLLIERAATLRSHAGQPAFPGGAQDPTDAGPVEAALREAREEVGLDPATVRVLGLLPSLWLPPSGFVVHPVVGWWQSPHPVHVVDPGEVAAVERVPLAELTDPANRFCVVHPSGYTGPAFHVRGLLVWGFTAGLVAGLVSLGGWERPWDRSRVEPLPPETLVLAERTPVPAPSLKENL